MLKYHIRTLFGSSRLCFVAGREVPIKFPMFSSTCLLKDILQMRLTDTKHGQRLRKNGEKGKRGRKEGRKEERHGCAVFLFLSRDLPRVEDVQFSSPRRSWTTGTHSCIQLQRIYMLQRATRSRLQPESARLPRQIPSPLFRPR